MSGKLLSTLGYPMVGLALLLGGCESKETHVSKVDQLVSAATEASNKPLVVERKKTEWKQMPSITVDDLGVYIGGERAHLKDKKKGPRELKDIVGRLPINNNAVTITANKKCNPLHVDAVVHELGKAGAPQVTIKTAGGRHDLPKEITVTPKNLVSKPKSCSVAVTVTKDASVGVWQIKGGGGTRFRRGFAGPDLTNTEDKLGKLFDRCDSDVAFFAADASMPWEHAYNLGALIRKVDESGNIKKLVLVGDEAVAGRKLKIAKD